MRNAGEPQDIEKTATIFREMVRHEDVQRHSRLTWLGQFEGFLFAALGLGWGKNRPLIYVLAAAGIGVATLVLCVLKGGKDAHVRLWKLWNEVKPRNYRGPGIFGIYPTKPTTRTVHFPGELGLPIIFILAWIAVAVIEYKRDDNAFQVGTPVAVQSNLPAASPPSRP